MFQSPMQWCMDNIDNLSSYLFERNQIMTFCIYLKIINVLLIIITYNGVNIYE